MITNKTLLRLALLPALVACQAPPLAAQQGSLDRTEQPASDSNSALSERIERLALRLVDTPAVKAAKAKGLAVYQSSPVGTTKPEGARFAKSAIDELAMQAALYAAMGAAPEPSFTWVYAPPHEWHGYKIGGSRWYADNADTLYRAVRIDPESSYEITLWPGETMPSQLSVMFYDFMLHEHGVSARSDFPVDTREVNAATPRNPDGSVTITVGPEPATGQVDHVQTKPQMEQILIREIRGDGSLPAVKVAIRQTNGEVPKSKSIDELADETARFIMAGADATLHMERVFGNMEDNKLTPINVRWLADNGGDQQMVDDGLVGPDKALGFLTSGQFNLAEDEALVITLDMLGCKYLGVNTYRPFFVTPPHVDRTSSLNSYQAVPNPDGTFTFIFARKDPGYFNWVDSGGLPFGVIAVRWQSLTRPVQSTYSDAVKQVEVVKLSQLSTVLPDGAKRVTPTQRAAQQAERARQYRLRCLGTECEVGGALDRPY